MCIVLGCWDFPGNSIEKQEWAVDWRARLHGYEQTTGSCWVHCGLPIKQTRTNSQQAPGKVLLIAQVKGCQRLGTNGQHLPIDASHKERAVRNNHPNSGGRDFRMHRVGCV